MNRPIPCFQFGHFLMPKSLLSLAVDEPLPHGTILFHRYKNIQEHNLTEHENQPTNKMEHTTYVAFDALSFPESLHVTLDCGVPFP